METQKYLIHELADKAGVTVRTIRYYTIEGLIPPPETVGRFAYYSEEHLYRLKLILRLKETFLPLREIRHTLNLLSDEEVRARLSELEGAKAAPQPDRPPAPQNRALDYIAGIGHQPSALREPTHPMRLPVPSPASSWNIWRRIEIAPGIELHIRERSSTLTDETIRRLIEIITTNLNL